MLTIFSWAKYKKDLVASYYNIRTGLSLKCHIIISHEIRFQQNCITSIFSKWLLKNKRFWRFAEFHVYHFSIQALPYLGYLIWILKYLPHSTTWQKIYITFTTMPPLHRTEPDICRGWRQRIYIAFTTMPPLHRTGPDICKGWRERILYSYYHRVTHPSHGTRHMQGMKKESILR